MTWTKIVSESYQDNIAFLITDGHNATSFLKIGDYFFISLGLVLMISPSNRVKSVRIDNHIATFEFLSNESKQYQVNLVDDIDKMIQDYINNFFFTVKNLKETQDVAWLTSFYPLDFWGLIPRIARIDVRSFIDDAIKKQDLKPSPTGQISCEIIIPDNLKIMLTDKKYYTKLGKGLFATRIPIYDYVTSEQGELQFINVVKSTVKSIKNIF